MPQKYFLAGGAIMICVKKTTDINHP